MVITTGCQDGEFCVRGKGDVTSEVMVLDKFSNLTLDIPANLYITYDPNKEETEVKLSSMKNLHEAIDISVINDELLIRSDKCINSRKAIDIYVTSSKFNKISMNGSGDIIAQNTIESNDLVVYLNGSGDINLKVKAKTVDGTVNGSGDMILSGTTDNVKLKLIGSGDIKAFELPAENGDVYLDGSGNIEVAASKLLKVVMRGSGDVLYKGSPMLDLDQSGSGELSRR